MAKLIISPTARQDLSDIFDYIAKDKPLAAARWIETMEQKCTLIAATPAFGELRPESRNMVPGSEVALLDATSFSSARLTTELKSSVSSPVTATFDRSRSSRCRRSSERFRIVRRRSGTSKMMGAGLSMPLAASAICLTMLPLAYIRFFILNNKKSPIGAATGRGLPRMPFNLVLLIAIAMAILGAAIKLKTDVIDKVLPTPATAARQTTQPASSYFLTNWLGRGPI